MKKNSKIFFFIFIIFFVLIGLSSINATSENVTQNTFSDIPSLENDLNMEESYQIRESTHVLNTSSFNEYVTDGKFNDKVVEGDTIDITGKLDDSKFALEVDKPVNIISSNGEGYIDFDTHCTDTSGGYRNGIFQVTKNGAGTNITGITFHNTRVYIKDTSNVVINNISCIVEQSVGMGVGSFSIRENSENITVKNSYFMNYFNGGHSNVVIAGASNCLIENNTIQCDNNNGLTGNLLYLTTYGATGGNKNITIKNNVIRTIGPGYSTNYGICLEGSGHIIEGNIIENDYPVMAQYANADYGTETNIDKIIFNNNTIVRGAPQLVFPGIVANNTFYGGALLKQVQTYNNTFNSVTIQNNVIFENNTATKVTVTGDNNTLDNNEIRSDDEYAITINGENNTLENNKILSQKGYGEEAITNSTEYVSINNSERLPRVFYITQENFLEYFDDVTQYDPAYCIKKDVFNDGDILVFTYDDIAGFTLVDRDSTGISHPVELVIENSTATIIPNLGKAFTIKNSFIPTYFYKLAAVEVTLINSTIGDHNFGNLLIKDEDSKLLFNYKYFLHNYVDMGFYSGIKLLDNSGYVLNDVEVGSTVFVCKFTDEYEFLFKLYGMASKSLYRENIYINKNLNFEAVPKLGTIGATVYLIDGSEGTTFTGITFENDVIVESDNIKFINCTFNKNVEFKNNLITLEGSTFYGNITLIASNNTLFNSNIVNSEDSISVVNSRNTIFENNTVTTTAMNTIVFDDESSNNIVRNNVLVAASLVGDDSVVTCDNIVEDNTPSYDTQIVIDCDNQAYIDDDFKVTITVNDLNNSKPVSKGYVEVYYSGYLIDIKDLTDGTTSVTIPVAEYIDDSDNYLKVWYYDGKRYNNNVTKKLISVVKSNVSIAVDEFNAKLNDKVEVTATFLNERGNPVQDTNVTFTVGRSTYTILTENGVATINDLVTSEWLDAAKIIVTFPGTDAYNSNSTTITLNTSKADIHITPSVTVEDNTASISLTLTDDLKQNVTDGKVTITTLDGTTLGEARVRDGKIETTVTLPDDYSDEYLVANFTGSYYYNDMVRNIKITTVLNSTITLETNSPLVGEELIINGKLTDSKNNPISNENIILDLNGTKVQLTTDEDGNYNYSYVPALGTSTITVTFNGNPDTYGTSTSKDVTIRDTDREMNEVLNQLDELTSENAKLKEQLENLTQLSNDLKEQLANQTSELSEQNAALQQQNDALQQQINTLSTIISALTNIIDKQNEQIAALNDKIDSLSAPENTTLVINQVTDAKYKANVVISGMLNSQKGMALSGQTITLTIGETSVDVTTKNGEFEYTTTFKSVGEQTITANYAGNDNYNPSETTTTFNVEKQDVIVTVDPIADASYGDNVTITGKFTDATGKAITNSNVRIFVNGKKYLARTDKTGAYTLSAKVTQVGENTVSVGYGGNTNYNAYEDTVTFNADKQDVIVTVNKVEDTKVGENITISGTFTYANGKAVTNSNVKILINGKKYLAKTDSTGAYTLTTLVTKDGINNITVGYTGNDKLNAYEDTITFNAEAQDVIITADNVNDVNLGENVTITGKFTDKNGKAITNSVVRVTFDGKKYSARTDNTGSYTFTATTKTEGTNTVTLSYAGSTKYNAYETTTTFNVIKTE